jgi:hypothetical protein
MKQERLVKTRRQAITKSNPDSDLAPLSPRLAFVVQFRTSSNGARPAYTGRVEHMTSGHVTHFRSQAELWTFLTQMVVEEEKRVRKEQESLSHFVTSKKEDDDKQI